MKIIHSYFPLIYLSSIVLIKRRYLLYCARRVSVITFIKVTLKVERLGSQIIKKKSFGASKPMGVKQDSPNRLWSPKMSEGEEP